MKTVWRFVSAGFLLACLAPSAMAHDARPVVVSVTEQLPGVFQYSITVPPTVEGGNLPTVVWPAGCTEQKAVSGSNGASGSVACDGGLGGKTLSLNFPYFNPSLATFYRLTNLKGEMSTAMLPPSQARWSIPVEPTKGNVALQYLVLGIEHIIGGTDHLLFVLGLLVIARTLKRILWTITGFTIAHSISLSLSALGFVHIPVMPVEAAIALSIVFLAHEISREHNDSLTYKFPLLVSFSFGLLHGLGFASALGQIGLVHNEILISLLFFNLGVEAGQIGFILTVILCIELLIRVVRDRIDFNDPMTLRRVDFLSAYLIGIPSSYWLIDRVARFLI